jgi:hypothetical protein
MTANRPIPTMTNSKKNSIININGIMKNKLAMKNRVKIISSNMGYQLPVFAIDNHWSLGDNGSPF